MTALGKMTLLGAALAMLSCSARSSTQGSSLCVEGQTASCECAGSPPGVETCGSDGYFGACACDQPQDHDPGGAGGAGGAGGTGGGGGQGGDGGGGQGGDGGAGAVGGAGGQGGQGGDGGAGQGGDGGAGGAGGMPSMCEPGKCPKGPKDLFGNEAMACCKMDNTCGVKGFFNLCM